MLVTSFVAQIRGIGLMKGTLTNVFPYGPVGDNSEGKRALLFGKIIISIIIFKVCFRQFSEGPGKGHTHTGTCAQCVFISYCVVGQSID